MRLMRLTALRMLARDWRGGELGVLLAALIIAVAIVSGISAFTSRLQNALEQESHRFLAADRVLSSSRQPGSRWLEEAAGLGLRTARTLSFPSMVFAGEESMYLASVKAASSHYPLRGDLMMSEQPFGDLRKAARGPGPGTVWLDSRLFPLLDIATGDFIGIGEVKLQVTGAVRGEPDQGASMFGYGPRVLMHYDDIAATGVVQPGSRVEYRQLFAGEAEQIRQFSSRLEPLLEPGQKWLDVESSRQRIGQALVRAEQFLLLAGSLGVVLAGVAIALAARRFSERHYDYVAIMKSLGSTSRAINRLYAASLLLLGGVAAALGCLLGWGLQESFFRIFSEALPLTPGHSGMRPYLIGAVTAMVCLGSFAWPPLRRLGKASPLRVLRRELPAEGSRRAADYLLGLAAVVLIMFWYSGDWKLVAAVLAGLVLSAGLAAAGAVLLLRGGRKLGMRAGSIWRLALAGLQRRGGDSTLQVVVFSMAIMLLLILLQVRTSLLEEWRMQLPPGAPNHFLLNIAPHQADAVRQTLNGAALRTQPLYPAVRGRVTHVNGQALATTDGPTEETRERESNLSAAAELPSDNQLLAGDWWPRDSREALVSVEEQMAEWIGAEVGDELRFLVGSQVLEARVASIRRADWESMQPNFWMLLPPAVLQNYPSTFITSFHLPAGQKPFLNDFLRRFPTVTVVEMDAVIGQVRSIVGQLSAAIELVLAGILAAGALVLIAGVQASVDSRLLEAATLRSLGARRSLLLGSLLIEFAALGLSAGLLATIGAEFSVWILQTQVLDMRHTAHPLLWLLGPLTGVALIGSLGVWNCRKVVSSPPLAVLREL